MNGSPFDDPVVLPLTEALDIVATLDDAAEQLRAEETWGHAAVSP